MKLALERAGGVPLTVKIFYDGNDAVELQALEQQSHNMLDMVLAASDRWRSVRLSVAAPLLPQLAAVRGRLGSLTALTISADVLASSFPSPLPINSNLLSSPSITNSAVNTSSFPSSFPWDTFITAPNLTHLAAAFYSPADALLAPPFFFPYHQLTHLTIAFYSNAEAFSLFPHLNPGLVCLRMEYTRTEELPPDADAPATVFPSLRVLGIQLEDDDNPDTPNSNSNSPSQQHPTISNSSAHPSARRSNSLLNHLTTPCLERLTTHHTADPAAVSALLSRSGCAPHMRHWAFHHHSDGATTREWEDAVLDLAARMPKLREMEVGDFGGRLLPHTGVPAFICRFAMQWLGGAQLDFNNLNNADFDLLGAYDGEGEKRELSLGVTDRLFPLTDDLARALEPLMQDGLFVRVGSRAARRSVLEGGWA
ncbi:hypothetical protein C8R44DRAFT_766918 [Mycena epipterygia]|nr:hypothetical protein C8R44DRAFT_766918 [Mycena epipterygia]